MFRTLVAVGALSAIYFGARYYDPDGYVALARPVCEGFTPEGCRLRWQDVPTEDGGVEAQCVQFCPRAADAPPPPRVVEVPAPDPAPVLAAAPAKGCELLVFNQPNFGGDMETVTEDESALNEQWDRQISSVQVKAGTWDLFTEPEFGGETIRLVAGSYPRLEAQWDKAIGSMMCAEPAQ